MINVLDYIDYFRTVAEHNKQILHDPNGDHHFYRADPSELLGELKGSKLKSPLLVLESHQGNLFDALSDNVRDMANGAFSVITLIPKVNDFAAIDAALSANHDICRQIVSKMRNDMQKNNTFIKNINFGQIQYHPVKELFDNGFGYRVTFNMEGSANIWFKESEWNGETIFSI